MNQQAEIVDEEPRCTKGLMIRRRTDQKGRKILISLAEDVPRTADLYELFKLGILIEIMDVEQTSDDAATVTLAIKGPEEFHIEREELIQYPRLESERYGELVVREKPATASELYEWSPAQRLEYLQRMEEGLARVSTYADHLKHDIMLAANRGWSQRNNERYVEFLAMKEECAILNEQKKAFSIWLKNAQTVIRDVNRRERTAHERDSAVRFKRAAREVLDEETFEKIRRRSEA